MPEEEDSDRIPNGESMPPGRGLPFESNTAVSLAASAAIRAAGRGAAASQLFQPTPLPLDSESTDVANAVESSGGVDEIFPPTVSISAPLEGVQSAGEVGTIRVESKPTNGTNEYVAQAVEFSSGAEDRLREGRFELLQARVKALELAVNAIRQPPGPGIGHNQGPTDLDSDLPAIDDLIALLKQEKTPFAVSNRQALIESEKRAGRVAEKIQEYVDIVCKEAAKSFGQEIGKQMGRLPLWLGLYGALQLVSSQLLAWLQIVAG